MFTLGYRKEVAATGLVLVHVICAGRKSWCFQVRPCLCSSPMPAVTNWVATSITINHYEP